MNHAHIPTLSRRKFLFSSTVITAYMMLSPSAFALNITENRNVSLAKFLTNKPLDQALVDRAFEALIKVDPNFQKKADALCSYIKDQQFQSIETLKKDAHFKKEHQTTARSIIAVFYLGYAGTPIPQAAHDNVRFVTYTEIETFKLTQKYTPIPGYSRWKTNYWANLPTA
ncbi:sorbitol dehydrogenase family protein [Ignatzschineria rhizosphaerae]|uniref:Sorbitol dehydrogenase family protein n=1 Tax=Ignatzschineria rhizosphaerae TaxID=2923279 RepID=A0ABY3WXQ0_9GAMM|nr:sorbitol dehydrogenase family protein [Ignatzschineria rhizosphaerae]UNM95381.1 sorbitol dehydrogenase family protein [Ignatzschineria rhizosphaerae]